MFYIIDEKDNVIGKVSYRPDANDLKKRNERFIESSNDVDLKKVKVNKRNAKNHTIDEVVEDKQVESLEQIDLKLIYHHMFMKSLKELRDAGKIQSKYYLNYGS